MNINQPKLEQLCYIRGDTAYFTTVPLKKQWGDDWDDAPYQQNAGTPYDKENITKIKFESDLDVPADYFYSQNLSVEQINNGVVPWLTDGKTHIFAGTSKEHFINTIQSTGGTIYSPISND